MNWIPMACVVVSAIALVLSATILQLNPRALLNRVVALAVFDYCLWAFFAGSGAQVFGRISPDPQWIPLRIALTADNFSSVLLLAARLVFARIRWRIGWVLVAPVLAASLVQAYQIWTGAWVISGFHQGSWGLVTDLNAGAIWPLFNAVVVNGAWLLGLLVLLWAWKRNPAKKYRSIASQLVVVNVLMNIGGSVCVALWLSLDWPDFSVLLGLVGVINYFVMIMRYRHLTTGEPRVTGALFASLPGAVLLVDHRGKVTEVSAFMASLLQKKGEELRGQPVHAVFDGWLHFDSRWKTATVTHLPQANLPGTIAGEPFLLTLTPGKDRFNDLEGVSVQLKPVTTLGSRVEHYGLSKRELEVARFIAEGLENQAVAEGLSISLATVKYHLNNLFNKTDTRNRLELVKALTSS